MGLGEEVVEGREAPRQQLHLSGKSMLMAMAYVVVLQVASTTGHAPVSSQS